MARLKDLEQSFVARVAKIVNVIQNGGQEGDGGGSQGKAFGMNKDEGHQSSGPLEPVRMMSCGTKVVGVCPSERALQKMKQLTVKD